MSTVRTCALVASLAIPAAALAQGAGAPSANPVSAAVRDSWDGAKRNLRESADLMPEANYAFKPVDTVRTFGQILAHVAGANYVFCAAAKGEQSPFAEDHFEKTATTKAAIVKAVTDSIGYCDGAYTALTDARGAEVVDGPFGGGKTARAGALISNAGHVQEHYGNLVTYFRIKGMVPPSSRR
jgi:DinB family protein